MKTVIFDFDGTLHLGSNAWKLIWAKLGYSISLDSDFALLYSSFMKGELTHQEWCDLSAKAFRRKSLKGAMLEKIGHETPLMKNVNVVFKALKENGFKIIIVSGSINKVIENALGESYKYVDQIVANEFVYDKRGIFKSIKGTSYDYEGKAQFIKEYIEKTGSSPEEVTFVGDGDNDEWVHTSGCNTICINPKDKTDHENREKWHQVIRTNDLKDLLPLIEKNYEDENEIV